MQGEIIRLLSETPLHFRVIDTLSPDDPRTKKLIALYIESFEDWGQALEEQAIFDYLNNYSRAPENVLAILELQGEILGCAMLTCGTPHDITTDLIHSIEASFEKTLSKPLRAELYRRITAHQTGGFLEVSEIFLTPKPVTKALIRDYFQSLLNDLANPDLPETQSLSPAGQASRKALHNLIHSFQKSFNPRRKTDKQVHDIYRLLSIFVLLGSLVYAEKSRLDGQKVTCVQWTCAGTPMHSLFKMVTSSKTAKRVSRALDRTTPLLSRIASRLPDNASVITGFINLGKNSTTVWEGEIGDGSRPKTLTSDYNRISVTRFPLEGILVLIYDWDVYSFFVRGKLNPRVPLRVYRRRMQKAVRSARTPRRIIPTFKISSPLRLSRDRILPRKPIFTRPKFSTPKILRRRVK